MDLPLTAQALGIVNPALSYEECKVHGYHSPRPSLTHRHHIVPLSWGGPDTEENLIEVCPTGHYSIHALLSVLKTFGGPMNLPAGTLRLYGSGERSVALEGWERYEAARGGQ